MFLSLFGGTAMWNTGSGLAEDRMHTLKPMEIGLLFRAGGDPQKTVRHVKAMGMRCGQLGVSGNVTLDIKTWGTVLASEEFTLVTLFVGYSGQDYTDIPTAQRTVGFVPRATRAEREARTCLVSDYAKALGVAGIACHVGFVPEDRTSSDYTAVRDMVRRVADHAARYGQTFALETGQEPPDALLRFLLDVERPNVCVNFDPANIILYGVGDPIAALNMLGRYVVTVHCKDGVRSPGAATTALGTETPLGQGAVGIGRFMAKLKEIGYKGPLIIEREIEEGERKTQEVRESVKLLSRHGGQAGAVDGRE